MNTRKVLREFARYVYTTVITCPPSFDGEFSDNCFSNARGIRLEFIPHETRHGRIVEVWEYYSHTASNFPQEDVSKIDFDKLDKDSETLIYKFYFRGE